MKPNTEPDNYKLDNLFKDCDSYNFNYDEKYLSNCNISDSTVKLVFEGLIKYVKRMSERGNSVFWQNFGTIGFHYSPDNKKKLYIKLDELFLARYNVDFQAPLGFGNKPFVPLLTVNLNVSDLSSLCGIDHATVAACLQAMSTQVGNVVSTALKAVVDLGELGKLLASEGIVSFKPQTSVQSMFPTGGKMSVRRLMEMKDMKTNMNFYRMGQQPESGLKKNASSAKIEMFKNVSQRLKTLSKSSSLRSLESTAFLKAGTDPLFKTQSCSELVDTPRDLFNAMLPNPRSSETQYPPLIENCVETLCVPVNNRTTFTTPTQRIGSNYSPKCNNIMVNYRQKKLVTADSHQHDHKLHADVRTPYEKMGGIQMFLSTQDPNEVEYKRAKQSLERYNTYMEHHIESESVAPIRAYWVQRIVDLLPSNMHIAKSNEVSRLIHTMVHEVKTDYIKANKKAILDYALAAAGEGNRLGITFIPFPPKIYGSWSSNQTADRMQALVYEKSLLKVENELPIFSEVTTTMQKVWVDEYQKSCDFEPWTWITEMCQNGMNILCIEEFNKFYCRHIAQVKYKFEQFYKYVDQEIVLRIKKLDADKVIERGQMALYVKSINDIITLQLRSVMNKILDDFGLFMTYFSSAPGEDVEMTYFQAKCYDSAKGKLDPAYKSLLNQYRNKYTTYRKRIQSQKDPNLKEYYVPPVFFSESIKKEYDEDNKTYKFIFTKTLAESRSSIMEILNKINCINDNLYNLKVDSKESSNIIFGLDSDYFTNVEFFVGQRTTACLAVLDIVNNDLYGEVATHLNEDAHKIYRYTALKSMDELKDAIDLKRKFISKIRNYSGIVSKSMVEIRIAKLNDELIKQFEGRIRDILKGVLESQQSIMYSLESYKKEISMWKAKFEKINDLEKKQEYDAWDELKKYEEDVNKFIYKQRSEMTDEFNRRKTDFLLMVNLQYPLTSTNYDKLKTCSDEFKNLVNSVKTYEEKYHDTKNVFITSCKEKRYAMTNERDEYQKEMIGFDRNKTLSMGEKGLSDSFALFTKLKRLKTDDLNTFEALRELDETDPAPLENLEVVYMRVESEYNLWNAYLQLKKANELIERCGTALEVVELLFEDQKENVEFMKNFDFLKWYSDEMEKLKNCMSYFDAQKLDNRVALTKQVLEQNKNSEEKFRIMKILYALGKEVFEIICSLQGEEMEDMEQKITGGQDARLAEVLGFMSNKANNVDLNVYLEYIKVDNVDPKANEPENEENN